MNGTSRGITQRTLAAVAMLALGLGTALIGMLGTAGGASAVEKVGVCHRTASDTNPYVYISVPEDEANGHITGTAKNHKSPRLWKSDGTWRGVSHVAGDEKWDYLAPGGTADCADTQPGDGDGDGDGEGPSYCPSDAATNAGGEIPEGQTEESYCNVEEEEECPDGSAFPTEDTNLDGTIDDLDCDEVLGSESSRPGDGDGDGDGDGTTGGGGGGAEVLGIEANAPAAAPTAVDAGLAEQDSSNSTLWLLTGAALAVMGAALGLTPARARGKRAR